MVLVSPSEIDIRTFHTRLKDYQTINHAVDWAASLFYGRQQTAFASHVCMIQDIRSGFNALELDTHPELHLSRVALHHVIVGAARQG